MESGRLVGRLRGVGSEDSGHPKSGISDFLLPGFHRAHCFVSYLLAVLGKEPTVSRRGQICSLGYFSGVLREGPTIPRGARETFAPGLSGNYE